MSSCFLYVFNHQEGRYHQEYGLLSYLPLCTLCESQCTSYADNNVLNGSHVVILIPFNW